MSIPATRPASTVTVAVKLAADTVREIDLAKDAIAEAYRAEGLTTPAVTRSHVLRALIDRALPEALIELGLSRRAMLERVVSADAAPTLIETIEALRKEGGQ